MKKVYEKRIFLGSILFITMLGSFSYGLIVVSFKVWPYQIINNMKVIGESLIQFGEIVPLNRFHTTPIDAPDERVVIYDAQHVQAGFYIICGWNQNEKLYTSTLYDEHGTLHHTWAIDYASLDPEGPHNKWDMPHAFGILKDGTIITSFARGDKMARLDPCGNPIWVKRGIYHHSLFRAENGSFWTWRSPGTPFGHHHYLENFNPLDGAVIREISLVEDIIKGDGIASTIFSTRRDYNFLDLKGTPGDGAQTDLFHPNDIEELSYDLADKFPLFEAGDLLISLRNLHLVCVIDPNSFHIKWWSIGPWRFQHDPDFMDDGRISVFNNNRHYSRSEIVQINPVTMEITNELHDGELHFYSKAMGKHQYLPNGNVLIVSSHEGRVIVTTKEGNKVMEFNNIVENQQKINARVFNGMWLPKDYFNPFPECSDGSDKE